LRALKSWGPEENNNNNKIITCSNKIYPGLMKYFLMQEVWLKYGTFEYSITFDFLTKPLRKPKKIRSESKTLI
jgi:hypothetical protein